MLPKPDHLGPEYGAQFADASVVAAYRRRPPYPDAVFDLLSSLIADAPRAVLDLGTGTGEIARGLIDRAKRIDALDFSPGMIAAGRRQPGGDRPELAWIEGRAEDAPLRPPYALVTAGQSLHWMEWDVVLPRVRDALTPRGVLALVGQREGPYPWDAAVLEVIQRCTTNTRYRPYDLIEELGARGLFRLGGRETTAPMTYERRVEEYVESYHARNGLSRDRLDPAVAAAFDREVTELVAPHAVEDVLTLRVAGVVVWGCRRRLPESVVWSGASWLNDRPHPPGYTSGHANRIEAGVGVALMAITEELYQAVVLADPEGRWELLRGQLREKPAMATEHNQLMRDLAWELRGQLDPKHFVVSMNAGQLAFRDETRAIPDIFVIEAGRVAESRRRRDPLEVYVEPVLLVVEVWSPSTGRYDVDGKIPEYIRRGDREIWRVHPDEKTLKGWRRQDDGTYDEFLLAHGIVEPVALPGVMIDLDRLFAPPE